MVHTTCSVSSCRSSSRINKELRFHRFPYEPERCKMWVEACDRPDLVGRSFESLKNTHICNLHFSKHMYGKRSLKRTAVPTLLLPTKGSVYTKIKIEILNDASDLPHKHCISKSIIRKSDVIVDPSLQNTENIYTKNCLGIDQSSQTPENFTDHTPRKRKIAEQLSKTCKKLKLIREKSGNVTEKLFLKGCDKFLCPKISAIVKTQIYLKPYCKSNRYSRKFKLFCLNMYYTNPLAYRFLSKTICLPSKSTLANIYLPIETKVNQQMWNVLTGIIKHMSSSEKECVLCMDIVSLKLNLSYDSKKDKILGLQEIDGQQQPFAADYAFTLMLQGLISKWKQPVGFSFISSNNMNDPLNTWIMNSMKHLLQLGFNIRALVSDLRSHFLALSKSLGISKENSCLEINGHKMYYVFDVPHLINSVRNSLMKYDFEFDGKTARWDDIINMYEHDKTKNIRSAPRLTDSHIDPNNFQKQKVRFAAQVFSNSVAAALKNNESTDIQQFGTTYFVETINNLFDLLTSSHIVSPKPYNKPYKGTTLQEELLDEAQHLFNSMRVKNKTNGRDVTNNINFINGFNVTINSLRQLYNDMKSDGYDYILTQRINNDSLKNFFRLVSKVVGNSRKPNCLQYTRVFRNFFLYQILNLAEATNFTEDFENVPGQFIEFTKNTPPSQFSTQPQPKRNITKVYIPEKNGFYYICDYLLRRCVDRHKRDCLSIINYALSYAYDKDNEKIYIKPKAYNPFGQLKAPPDDFINYISSLETEFISIFTSFIGNNIGSKLFHHLSTVEFNTMPCVCFPKDFMLKLFIRIRIFHIIKLNNRNFEFKSGKYLSVTRL